MPAGTITLPQLFRNHGYTTVSVGKIYHYNHDDPDGWFRRYADTFGAEGEWCDGYCSGYQLSANRALVENYLRGKRLSDGLPASSITEITDTPDENTPDGIIARHAIEELQQFKQSGATFFLATGFYRPHMPLTAPRSTGTGTTAPASHCRRISIKPMTVFFVTIGKKSGVMAGEDTTCPTPGIGFGWGKPVRENVAVPFSRTSVETEERGSVRIAGSWPRGIEQDDESYEKSRFQPGTAEIPGTFRWLTAG